MRRKFSVSKTVCFIFMFLTFMIYPGLILSQSGYIIGNIQDFNQQRIWQKVQQEKPQFTHIPKKPGHYTAEEWRAVIDATWGEGLPTETKLQIFDDFWTKIDEKYPSFHGINLDWDSLRDVYRPEVAAGVSRGRFYAIMCQLFLKLQDSHCYIYDKDIALDSLKLGVPLFVASGYNSTISKEFSISDYCHFGAGLSPLPDSSLLVYQVVPDHPLGLQVGDIILGYDGIPWKNLYKELLAAELPFDYSGIWLGTTELSSTHHRLTSAGENWHLFDTIDIVKFDSGDTLHLSTSAMQNKKMQLFSSAQIPIQGVPFPDIDNGHAISWGLIEGTQIGYIYAWNWFGPEMDYHSTAEEFEQAITTLINEYDTKGIIIDSRRNTGGENATYLEGLKILFNSGHGGFKNLIRADPNDHFALTIIGNHYASFNGDKQFYDKPIAVLTGPASVSHGDLMPLQMRAHPMVKTFGLPTDGAFSGNVFEVLDYSNTWECSRSVIELSTQEEPDNYLSHSIIPVDEEVWLTREDVVNGDDTVVKKALEWINTLSYAHDVRVNPAYIKPSLDTLTITATVENPTQHDLSVLAYIAYYDSVMADSIHLFNDGNHNDGSAGDSIWGGLVPPVSDEKYYQVSVKTEDLTSETVRTIPNVALFTSAGPVVLEDYTIVSADTTPNPGDSLDLRLTLKNAGSIKKVTEIKASIINLDSFAVVTKGSGVGYSDIKPGVSANAFLGGKFSIKIEEDCPPNSEVKFLVVISSISYPIWSDTLSLLVLPVTGIEDQAKNVPLEFALYQNYPNPFNPKTVVSWQVGATSMSPVYVDLSIYNVLGQKVVILVTGKQNAGFHSVEWDAGGMASGVYYYRLKAEGFVETKQLVLLR